MVNFNGPSILNFKRPDVLMSFNLRNLFYSSICFCATLMNLDVIRRHFTMHFMIRKKSHIRIVKGIKGNKILQRK